MYNQLLVFESEVQGIGSDIVGNLSVPIILAMALLGF